MGSSDLDHGLGQQIIVADSDGLIRQGEAGQITPALAASMARQPSTVPAPPAERLSQPVLADAETVTDLILDALARALDIPRETIETDVPFSDYGIDSILGVSFIQQLSDALGLRMNTTILFDHTTVARLCAHLLTRAPTVRDRAGTATASAQAEPVSPARARLELPAVGMMAHGRATPMAAATAVVVGSAPVSAGAGAYGGHGGSAAAADDEASAIIGMGGQFPGAADGDSFGNKMGNGINQVRELPDSR